MVVMNSDRTAIAEAFSLAVIHTFAHMAFIDVIEEKNHEGEIPYKGIMGLEVMSPARGQILFFMTRECKRALVENIYGEDWINLTDLEIDDCLLEIVNVLVGDFLKNLFGIETKVIMSFPRLYFDDLTVAREAEQLNFVFNAEGAMFSAAVDLKN